MMDAEGNIYGIIGGVAVMTERAPTPAQRKMMTLRKKQWRQWAKRHRFQAHVCTDPGCRSKHSTKYGLRMHTRAMHEVHP